MSSAMEINNRIYETLFSLENLIRELIVEKLTDAYGVYWYKQALPDGGIIAKYRQAREYEKATPWTQCVPQHPIYYLDFPDLATIIERKVNWEVAFKHIFSRKEVVVSTLRELEPVRNKIAHNRIATKTDLDIAESAFAKFLSYLGESYAMELLVRCTSYENLYDRLASLLQEARTTSAMCMKYEPIQSLEVWLRVRKEWWFDSEYLGHELTLITKYFGLMEEYVSLPRLRGTGHEIENWVTTNMLPDIYPMVEKTITEILEDLDR